MTRQPTPRLTSVAADTYRCADIPALHRWLEARGYTFYGQHYPGEYGRFSCQEQHEQAGRKAFVHSYIQVLSTGEVFAPDPHARDLLAALVEQRAER